MVTYPGKSLHDHHELKQHCVLVSCDRYLGYKQLPQSYDKRTRAYLRNAEFGFLGVIVPDTCTYPRFCGELLL